MGLPANVAEAVRILHGAEESLRNAMNLGFTTAVVVPGPVAAPEETTIVALRTDGLPGPIARKAVLWPDAQYMAWRAAWEVLMAYTGWWGPRAKWPLGDGLRAKADPREALKMPPLGGAMAAITGTLIAVETAGWKPDVRLESIVAPLVFIAGARYAYLAYKTSHR